MTLIRGRDVLMSKISASFLQGENNIDVKETECGLYDASFRSEIHIGSFSTS